MMQLPEKEDWGPSSGSWQHGSEKLMYVDITEDKIDQVIRINQSDRFKFGQNMYGVFHCIGRANSKKNSDWYGRNYLAEKYKKDLRPEAPSELISRRRPFARYLSPCIYQVPNITLWNILIRKVNIIMKYDEKYDEKNEKCCQCLISDSTAIFLTTNINSTLKTSKQVGLLLFRVIGTLSPSC
jgi:hypothetical protein